MEYSHVFGASSCKSPRVCSLRILVEVTMILLGHFSYVCFSNLMNLLLQNLAIPNSLLPVLFPFFSLLVHIYSNFPLSIFFNYYCLATHFFYCFCEDIYMRCASHLLCIATSSPATCYLKMISLYEFLIVVWLL